MQRSINGATTRPYPLEQDVHAAAAAGFDGVEFWWPKLRTFLERQSGEDAKALLISLELELVGICPLRIWPFRDSEPARLEFREAVAVAPQVGCDVLMVCADYQPANLTASEALAVHAEELRDMARLAAAEGVRLSIEPIGRHTLVPGPAEALRLIEMAGSPDNVGLVMDTFHFFRSAVSDDDVRAVPVEMWDVVQVNDCEHGAIDELADEHRLYPTLGVIPAERQLSILKDLDYQGYLSVEIFRPEYWESPIEHISELSCEYLENLIARL